MDLIHIILGVMMKFNDLVISSWESYYGHCADNLLDISATTNTLVENSLEFNHVAETLLLQTALFLKIGIESFALLILTLGIIKGILKLLAVRKRLNHPKTLCSVRLDLGLSLTLALEFLLAADIAATAVSPSWDEIGKLAAISGIRTFLNYFLQQEVKELEKQN